MARILITGMSAVGKSSLLAELGRRGHRVVDMDDDGWSAQVPAADGPGEEQTWVDDRVRALLAEPADGDLFVGGCASNQGRYYDRFDEIVLLSLPVQALLRRLESRRTNDFGKAPDERTRVMRDVAEVEPRLRATCTAELDSRRPLAELADAVEALAAGQPMACRAIER